MGSVYSCLLRGRGRGGGKKGESGDADHSTLSAADNTACSRNLEMTSRRLFPEGGTTRRGETKRTIRPVDADEPGTLSRILLLWIGPYIRKGFWEPLTADTMPSLRSEFGAKRATDEAFPLWDDMVERSRDGKGPKASVFRLIWTMNKTSIMIGLLFGVLQGLLNNAARPILLDYLILTYAESADDLTRVLLILFAVGLAVLAEGFFKAAAQTVLHTDVGTKTLSWLVPLIQRKATRVRLVDGGSDGDDDRSSAATPGSESNSTSSSSTSAESSIIGNDCLRSFEICRYVVELPQHVVGLIAGVAALVYILGHVAIIGLVTMATAMVLNRLAAQKSKPIAEKDLQAADARLSSMREIIESITQVKFMSWEQQYMELLTQLRSVECRWILLYRLVIVVSLTVGRISPVLASCATFTYMGMSPDHELEPNTIFSALAAFNALRLPLIAIPLELVVLNTVEVSHDRIVSYLLRPEFEGIRRRRRRRRRRDDENSKTKMPSSSIPTSFVTPAKTLSTTDKVVRNDHRRDREDDDTKKEHGFVVTVTPAPETPSTMRRVAQDAIDDPDVIVDIRDAWFAFSQKDTAATMRSNGHGSSTEEEDEDERKGHTTINVHDSFCLRDINLSVRRGELVGIAGEVGSGKSALLLSILGSMHRMRGVLRVDVRSSSSSSSSRRLGYVPQRPFIFSGTVRDNVVVGRTFDENLLNEAIRAAALDRDLTLMPRGLRTEIGERGVTLSGGQKMRIAIARAVYGDPALLIMDDALAAVDGHVAGRIWTNVCESRRERGLTTIMALNQRQFLPFFDKFLELREGSRERFSVSTQKRVFSQSKKTPREDVDEDESTKTDERDAKTSNKVSSERNTRRLPEKLIEDEERRTGNVDLSLSFEFFFKRAGGWHAALIVLLLGCSAYGLMAATDLWLAAWVADDGSFGGRMSDSTRAFGYIGFSLGQALLVFSLSSWDAWCVNKSCRAIHADCMGKLLRAPSLWFQRCPSGRIMSRFSSDLSLVDHMLADTIDNMLQFTFIVVSLVIVVSIIVVEIIPAFAIGIVVYALSVTAVNRSNREAKRETNNAQSPMLTTMAEAVNGRLIIRVMGFEDYFLSRQIEHVDAWNRFNYFACSTVVFQSIVTSTLGFFFSMSAAGMIYINIRYFSFDDIALIGVALNYVFILPYFLGIYSSFVMSITYAFTSMERIAEYASDDFPQEPAWSLPNDPSPRDWPSDGRLEFRDVSMRYRPGLPLALRGVNVIFEGGHRVGVVGRTGAGKSSLISLLFRLTEAASGRVEIDGRDAKSVGLHCLRNALAILPQTPLLFPGSLAHNLDPFRRRPMTELLASLRRVGLVKQGVGVEALQSSASDLSVGQLQLLALARLLLVRDRVKIIVMDEPTANIDVRTDAKLQAIIASEFKDKTMITIAHRLETIIDYDRVLVMDSGRAAEFDSPRALLQKRGGLFSNMVASLGSDTARALREMASS